MFSVQDLPLKVIIDLPSAIMFVGDSNNRSHIGHVRHYDSNTLVNDPPSALGILGTSSGKVRLPEDII